MSRSHREEDVKGLWRRRSTYGYPLLTQPSGSLSACRSYIKPTRLLRVCNVEPIFSPLLSRPHLPKAESMLKY